VKIAGYAVTAAALFLALCGGNDDTTYGVVPDPGLYKIVEVSVAANPGSFIALASNICYVSRSYTSSQYGSYALLFVNKGDSPVFFAEARGITFLDKQGVRIGSNSSSAYIFSRVLRLTPSDMCTNTGFLPGDTGGIIDIQDSIYDRIAAITIDSISYDTYDYSMPCAVMTVSSYAVVGTSTLDFLVANNGTCGANTMGFNETIFTDNVGVPMAWAMTFPPDGGNIVVPGGTGIVSCISAQQVPWANCRLFFDYEDTVLTMARKTSRLNRTCTGDAGLAAMVKERNDREAEKRAAAASFCARSPGSRLK
jgi:hypothetical protein